MGFSRFKKERPASLPAWAWGAAFVGVAMTWATPAHAEPTTNDKAGAHALMAEGRALRNQGNFTAALQRFQSADNIMHAPPTGLELARTQDVIGRLVDARATARRVVSIPILPTDPPTFQEAQSSAAALAAQLDERIPTIKFVVPDRGSGGPPVVWVDGRLLSAATIGSPLRLDPGAHQVVARFGEVEASQSIVLRERDYQPIVLRVASSDERRHASAPGGAGWRAFGYVGLGVSSAALVTGAVAGALAMSSKRIAEVGCLDSRCPPSTWTDMDRARTYASVSTFAFVTSAVAFGLGLGALLLAPSPGRETTIRARPQVGLGVVGIEGSF
jgi:hypothetical protein